MRLRDGGIFDLPYYTVVNLWDVMERVDPKFVVNLLVLSAGGGTVSGIAAALRGLTAASKTIPDRKAADLLRIASDAASSEFKAQGPELEGMMGLGEAKEQNEIADALEAQGLRMSAAMLRDAVANPTRDLSQYLPELYREIRREIKSLALFRMLPDNIKHYAQPTVFGQQVSDSFPSASFDLEEAGNCLAMDRTTATVFHLMRVLEVVLKGVGKALGIPDPVKEADRNWGAILRKIRTELDRRNSTNDPAWPPLKDFYEDAYTDLCAIKRAWRNPVMHVEGVYDRERALHVFNVVGEFLKQIADRVGEGGQLP